MSASRSLAVSTLALLATAACTGLGSVPSSLIELYDQAAPNGVIEIEIERNGTIREMEADIPISALPTGAREAALTRLPGAQITGAERELRSDGRGWEVKLNHEGRNWEIVVDDTFAIVETEKELTMAEAPVNVIEAARQAVAGGAIASVEIIERGETREYHVKKVVDGASYKIVLGGDATVTRVVREQRAEIEISLSK